MEQKSVTTFTNPPFNLDKRSLILQGSPRFQEILQTLALEFNKKKLHIIAQLWLKDTQNAILSGYLTKLPGYLTILLVT